MIIKFSEIWQTLGSVKPCVKCLLIHFKRAPVRILRPLPSCMLLNSNRAYCTLRNEMERNEMGNLYFAKWENLYFAKWENLYFAKWKYDKRENESLMNKQTIKPLRLIIPLNLWDSGETGTVRMPRYVRLVRCHGRKKYTLVGRLSSRWFTLHWSWTHLT